MPDEPLVMIDLYTKKVDEDSYKKIEDGDLEYAPIIGADDAFAVRDSSQPHMPSLRFHGADLRKIGIAI